MADDVFFSDAPTAADIARLNALARTFTLTYEDETSLHNSLGLSVAGVRAAFSTTPIFPFNSLIPNREIDTAPGSGSSRSDVWRLTLGRLLEGPVMRDAEESEAGELKRFTWRKVYDGMGDALEIAMSMLMGTNNKFLRATIISVEMELTDDGWMIVYTRDITVSPSVSVQQSPRAEDAWFGDGA